MRVGILQAELCIDGSQSLKDKRRVVSSLKDRLHREFQISVAEVDALDNHRKAIIGITMASNSTTHCHQVLDTILDRLRDARGYYLQDHAKEVLAGG